MKLYIEDDNGIRIEIKELKEVNSENELIIFTLQSHLSREAVSSFAEKLKQITTKKCIILGPEFGKIYGA